MGLATFSGCSQNFSSPPSDFWERYSFIREPYYEFMTMDSALVTINSTLAIVNHALVTYLSSYLPSTILAGPNRAFGDLTAASGITEAMLDSLLALKDLEGIDGLAPLSEIEDIRFAKAERKSSMAEIERKKQEEVAKTYVRQVDDKGRAYGTERRKCSIARVWIQPGDGKFLINDKQFEVYLNLDNCADLLRPFAETKTLGLWDVTCTVKGGGVSGPVGAIRLGISIGLYRAGNQGSVHTSDQLDS